MLTRAFLIVTAVCAISLLALMPYHIALVGMYDEGIILTGALRVLGGEIPHRDFYANYGPAQFYLVAALLHLSDGSFLAARAYDMLVKAMICGALFVLVRRTCRPGIALMTTAVVWLWFMGLGTHLYPVFPCVLLTLLACGLLAKFLRDGARQLTLSAAIGALSGLTALFRYDVGFLLLAANLAAVAVTFCLTGGVRDAARRFLPVAAAYAGGALLVFAPVAALFLAVSSPDPFVHDIVRFPLAYYGRMRSLPFPAPTTAEGLVVYLPIVAIVLAIVELRESRQDRASPAKASDRLVDLIVFGSAAAAFLVKGVVRVSAIHMILAAVPSLVIVAMIVDRWSRAVGGRRHAGWALATFVIISGLGVAVVELPQLGTARDRTLAGWLVENGHAGDGCAPLLSEPYARVADYIMTHSAPDERIFVATGRHDKIFVNAVALYFAANRLPATHWHHFDPGLQTRADVQKEIIAELQQGKVRWIVRDHTFDAVVEPNESARSSNVTLLDEYLSKAYRPVFSAGQVEVLLEAGESPPAPRPATSCVRHKPD